MSSDELRKAGYPFSLAVRAGDLIFLSGQIGIDWKTNKRVPGTKKGPEAIRPKLSMR